MELQSSQALPAGTQVEEFVIERVLGAGGFGITYLARDKRLDRPVVIKENLPAQFCFRDPSSMTVSPRHTHGDDVGNFLWSLENFSKEATMLASLDHPGIVKVLRSFEAFGTAYFVMPYVEGLALDELAQRAVEAPFSEDELRGLLDRMLDALKYLHDRGIYHRDIKPGNILITNVGMSILIDFGSARQRLSERSMTVVESAGYTPFEQLQSRGNVGPWSDLYALAATIVKIMTGEAPPKTNDRTMGDPWQPLSDREELRGGYSARFLECLDRALRLPIEERWQNADEWKKKLAEAITPKVKVKMEGQFVIPVAVVKNQTLRPNAPMVKPTNPVLVTTLTEKEEHSNSKGLIFTTTAAILVFLVCIMRFVVRDKSASEPNSVVSPATAENESIMVESSQSETGYKKRNPFEGSRAGEEKVVTIAPGVSMTFCWCPAGDFVMGSPKAEEGRQANEDLVKVRINKGFWMGKTEVTQAQWQAVMGSNPSYFEGDNLPVEQVSWSDTQTFLTKLNGLIGSGEGGKIVLPTEAQWEYACRAGETGPYSGGTLDQVAWYEENSVKKTHAVGTKKANAWGLHDMHGNVWEWCQDEYNPRSNSSGSYPYRMCRGGCWCYYAFYCRAAVRNCGAPSNTSYYGGGFRVARCPVP
jgi:formylglycine-generating enzyme required for sulfatase activity